MAVKINNLKDLQRHIQKDIEDGKPLSYLKNDAGESFEAVSMKELKEAAALLELRLKEWIQKYYDSYEPSPEFLKRRTGKFKACVRNVVVTENGGLKAVVYFDDEGAIRDSFMKNQPQGYLPALLNDGWLVTRPVIFRDIYHVGFYRHQAADGVGFHFIEHAVAEAKRDPRFKNVNVVVHKECPSLW